MVQNVTSSNAAHAIFVADLANGGRTNHPQLAIWRSRSGIVDLLHAVTTRTSRLSLGFYLVNCARISTTSTRTADGLMISPTKWNRVVAARCSIGGSSSWRCVTRAVRAPSHGRAARYDPATSDSDRAADRSIERVSARPIEDAIRFARRFA